MIYNNESVLWLSEGYDAVCDKMIEGEEIYNDNSRFR